MADVVDMCTIADVRAQGEMQSTQTTSDALIQSLITAASRIIVTRYEREFTPQSSGTRRFRVDSRVVTLSPFDLRAVTAVTLHPESGSPQTLTMDTGYSLAPVNGSRVLGTFHTLRLASRLPLTSSYATAFGHALVAVTGDWGAFTTASVPDDLRRGCVLTVASWLDRAIADYSLQGDDGRGLRPGGFGGWPIPAAAHRIFQPYARMVV